MQFHQIPAFTDNYLWMIESLGHSWVVDPGDGQVIIQALKQQSSILDGILITHHHADHIGGIGDLITWVRENQGHDLRIIGPDKDTIPHKTQTVYDGEIVEIFTGVHLQVLEVPGHTKGHIAYFLPKIAGLEVPRLYCGDTLFAGGCGRLLEGTAAQMYASLMKLMQLPDETLVCCAHEYTLANLRFAAAVEPTNHDLSKWTEEAIRMREAKQATVPTTLGLEKKVNPFLRSDQGTVRESIERYAKKVVNSGEDIFTITRLWKDSFK